MGFVLCLNRLRQKFNCTLKAACKSYMFRPRALKAYIFTTVMKCKTFLWSLLSINLFLWEFSSCLAPLPSFAKASSMSEVIRLLADSNAFLTKKIEASRWPWDCLRCCGSRRRRLLAFKRRPRVHREYKV